MTNDNSKADVSIHISGGNFKDFVAGNKEIEAGRDYIDTQTNYFGQAPDVTELAHELDELLQTMEQNVPNPASEIGKEAIKEKGLQEIEKKPLLKQKLLAALKAGTIKTVEEFCKHPVASVLLAAFKAAFPDEKKA